VFFTQPFWVSILVPVFLAPVLLMVSLVVQPRRGDGFDTSVFLSIAGLAMAFVMGGAVLAVVLLGFVLFTHAIAFAIERAVNREDHQSSRGLQARVWLVAAVAVHLAMVAAIVRAGLTIVRPRGSVGLLVPFGVSYFAFHGISYVVDVYRRRVVANHSRCQLAVHLMLLPMIAGGPVNYRGIAPQLAHGWPSLSDYSYGVRRLVIGVWKVFVVAELAGREADSAFALRPVGLNALAAWLGLASFTLQIYYAFSGYSDMGLGLARMVGIRLQENFRWPYVGQTVGEFWQRWHLGLSAWFREYATLSLDGDRSALTPAMREAVVILLCGIWYGAGWSFVAWGVYQAALILAERTGIGALVQRLPIFARHVYVLVAVMAGWVILRGQTLDGVLLFFKALAGQNSSALGRPPTVAPEVWLVLVTAAIGCAPVFQAVRRWTVAIDGLILALLMLLFAPFLFAWRCGSMVVTPIARWWRLWRSSAMRADSGR
jgi:D-alanyl-lipoteichoic acid acyltransferase DltB (MBOAT superfamily)